MGLGRLVVAYARADLGGHLCTELLARMRATVYCLSRGAAQRSENRLADLHLAPGERIVHVAMPIRLPPYPAPSYAE
ncbi:hypothetical protein WKI65_35985 [Streptomyces sp. MS1.AVA.3]|uniref:hypothetical protein n=1 Tax=Streptomyces decoyicus TaxID=249567 RepID=UPI0030C0C941